VPPSALIITSAKAPKAASLHKKAALSRLMPFVAFRRPSPFPLVPMTSRAVPHTRHNMVAGPSRADRPRHIQLPTFDQSDLPVDLSPESLDDPTSIFYISRNKAARPSTDLGHRPGAHKRAQSNPSPLALADSTPSPPLKTAGMLSRVWGSFREKKKANQAQDSQLDVIVSPSSQVSPPVRPAPSSV
jgi:hypothetical protein